MAQPVEKVAGGRFRGGNDSKHTPGLAFGTLEPSADHGAAVLKQGLKIAIEGYG
jgi:hypothetical protein